MSLHVPGMLAKITRPFFTVGCGSLERRLIHRDLIINNSGNIGNTGNSPE